MYISKLYIRNFKCFSEVTVSFEPNINIIIGGNNAGKSTMFEAIRLWYIAFLQFLKERTNSSQNSSFYSTEYFSFTLADVVFLRICNFESLFNNKNNCSATISLFLKENNEEVELPIEFTKTTEGHNLRFSLCSSKLENDRVAASNKILSMINRQKGSSLKKLLLCTYLYPMFLLPINEPEYGEGYIKYSLHTANAENVIRNILNLKGLQYLKSTKKAKRNSGPIFNLERNLHEILTGQKLDKRNMPILRFYIDSKKGEKAYINIIAEKQNKTQVELAQLGSGTINLINILATLLYGDYKNYNLSIMLLDEPDSHLHSDHQHQLFSFLNETSKETNKQIFIISHNHELIDNFDNVVFVDKTNIQNKCICPISKDDYLRIYKTIAPEYHKKILEIFKSREELKSLNNILDIIKKPTVLVEGDSDASLLKKAFEKLYGKNFFDGKIEIVSCPNSVSGIKFLVESALKDNIMGIVDCDPEGEGPYNDLSRGTNFVEEDGVLKRKGMNVYFMKLPVPTFRSSSAMFFNKNTFIEYLFTDAVLEKNEVEMVQVPGNNFKTIKGHFESILEQRGDNKNKFKSELKEQKTKLHQHIQNMEKEDFESFSIIFNHISNCFQIPI